jgi:hypothetical protein
MSQSVMPAALLAGLVFFVQTPCLVACCPPVPTVCLPPFSAPSVPSAAASRGALGLRQDNSEQRFATPTAAPPSAEPEETVSAGRPEVSETHAFFEVYSSMPRASEKLRPDRCVVGFWNLTHQPVALTIGEKTQALAPGVKTQLDLPREFIWQVDNREPQSAKVPASAAGLDIVIRRQP